MCLAFVSCPYLQLQILDNAVPKRAPVAHSIQFNLNSVHFNQSCQSNNRNTTKISHQSAYRSSNYFEMFLPTEQVALRFSFFFTDGTIKHNAINFNWIGNHQLVVCTDLWKLRHFQRFGPTGPTRSNRLNAGSHRWTGAAAALPHFNNCNYSNDYFLFKKLQKKILKEFFRIFHHFV